MAGKVPEGDGETGLGDDFREHQRPAPPIATTCGHDSSRPKFTARIESAGMGEVVGIVNGTEHQIHFGIEQAFIVPRGDLKGVVGFHIRSHGIQRRVRVVTHPFHAVGQTVKKLRDPVLNYVELGKWDVIAFVALLCNGMDVVVFFLGRTKSVGIRG